MFYKRDDPSRVIRDAIGDPLVVGDIIYYFRPTRGARKNRILVGTIKGFGRWDEQIELAEDVRFYFFGKNVYKSRVVAVDALKTILLGEITKLNKRIQNTTKLMEALK